MYSLYTYFSPLEYHYIGRIRCRGLHWVGEIKSVHGYCEIGSIFWIGNANVGAEFMCGLYILLGGSLPCPDVYVTLEAWFPSLELGLPSSLMFDATVAMSPLVVSMMPLMLPSIGPMLSKALVIAFIVIRRDDSRTFKIMLRTTGHESR